tara:strand:+ start:37 stop:300 length:264 start_codon:yes stop_codon:yes gene_type:complete
LEVEVLLTVIQVRVQLVFLVTHLHFLQSLQLVVEVEVLEEAIEEQMVDLEVELILLDHLIQAVLVILLQLIPHKEMMVEQEILQVAN